MTEREELFSIIENADEEQIEILIETFIEVFGAIPLTRLESHHCSSSLRCQ